MLASIAANAGPSRAPSQKAPALGTSTSRSPATPIKFSDDTARLQQINSIRKSPIGSQIKLVIDLLREERQAFTPEQINERTHVDINGNRAVFDSLSKNPKSKHDLRDKNHLLALIQKFPEGIAVIDLKDAYPTVVEDLQVARYNDPRDACSVISGESYKLWLENENRTDDITIIIVQVKELSNSSSHTLRMGKETPARSEALCSVRSDFSDRSSHTVSSTDRSPAVVVPSPVPF